MQAGKWPLRILFYVAGVFILAMGVSLSILSDLGVSPVSSVPLVAGRITGVSTGNMTMIIYSVYVLLQIPLMGREWKVKNLLQFPAAVLFGKFIDVTGGLVAFLAPSTYPQRLALTLSGIVLIALAMKLYLPADIVPIPGDGLMLAISRRSGLKTSTVKNFFDLGCVALSAAAGLIFTGGIIGLREGTVLAALLTGRVMALLEPLFKDRIRELCGTVAEKL